LWFAFRFLKTIFDIHYIDENVKLTPSCDLLSDF
jgi:hypothetical protein